MTSLTYMSVLAQDAAIRSGETKRANLDSYATT